VRHGAIDSYRATYDFSLPAMCDSVQTTLLVTTKLEFHQINKPCREQTMEEPTQALQPVCPTPHRRRVHERALFHVPLCPSSAVRSTKNIALWKSYLPTACVRKMIRMGWDYTT
jgi:hypothetical protein